MIHRDCSALSNSVNFAGGEAQQISVTHADYSATAHCTGKPAYLEPNSQSLQKPIEGRPPQFLAELYKEGAIVSSEH